MHASRKKGSHPASVKVLRSVLLPAFVYPCNSRKQWSIYSINIIAESPDSYIVCYSANGRVPRQWHLPRELLLGWEQRPGALGTLADGSSPAQSATARHTLNGHNANVCKNSQHVLLLLTFQAPPRSAAHAAHERAYPTNMTPHACYSSIFSPLQSPFSIWPLYSSAGAYPPQSASLPCLSSSPPRRPPAAPSGSTSE